MSLSEIIRPLGKPGLPLRGDGTGFGEESKAPLVVRERQQEVLRAHPASHTLNSSGLWLRRESENGHGKEIITAWKAHAASLSLSGQQRRPRADRTNGSSRASCESPGPRGFLLSTPRPDPCPTQPRAWSPHLGLKKKLERVNWGWARRPCGV